MNYWIYRGRWTSLRLILLAGGLALVLSFPAHLQGTEIPEDAEATRYLLQDLKDLCESRISNLQIMTGKMPEDSVSMGLIIQRSRAALMTREIIEDAFETPKMVGFNLGKDTTTRVKDPHGTLGIVLTGKWVQDYAKMIRIVPEYERTLAVYREQSELQDQLVFELEGIIEIKDQKVSVLQEMELAQDHRAELYRDLYEARRDGFIDRVLRKLAFPTGIAIGLVVGTQIAN